MRPFLIFTVLLGTVFTFYSALVFKSEVIERDIDIAIKDELASADVSGVDVQTDGRHVTLTGVVYDAADEARLLDLAAAIPGALGPIDGLTQVADSGFIAAVKTADGITLTGTVPDEAARLGLIEAADAATDGAVTDQLSIGGVAQPWHAEAAFGLNQMAAIATGTMTAGVGSYILSGTATDADGPVEAALEDRGAWLSFVTPPDVSGELAGQIETLEQDLAAATSQLETRDAMISEVETRLNAAEAELATASEAREELAETAATTQTALEAEVSRATDLAAQLLAAEEASAATSQAFAEEKGALTAALEEQTALISQRDATIDELSQSMEAAQSDLAAETERAEALAGNMATAEAEFETGQSSLRAELTAGALLIAEAEVARSTLADERDTLAAALEASEVSLRERDAAIESLTADLGQLRDGLPAEDRNGFQNELTAQSELLAERDAAIAEMTAELTTLQADLGASVAEAAGLAEQLAGVETTLSEERQGLATDLALQTALVAERDGAIAELSTSLQELELSFSSERDGLSSQIAEQTAEVAEREAAIETLTSDLNALQARLATEEAASSDLATELDTMKTTLTADRAGFEAELAVFTTSTAEKEATISELSVDLDEVRAALATSQAGAAELSQRLASVEDTLRDRDETLATTVSDGEAAATAASATIAGLQSRIEAQAKTAAGQENTYVASLSLLEGERDEAVKTLSELATQAEAKDAQIAQLTAQLDTAGARVSETAAEVAALQTARSAVAQQCSQRASDVIETGSITFATNTDVLRPGSEALLERLTGIALACVTDGVELEVGGHTDDRGEDLINQRLSEARAAAVVAFMTARGVPETALSAVGYGETNPVADNGTPAGRATNRRISFSWQNR